MIIDKLLQVSDRQAVTATAVSTDTLDFGPAVSDMGFDTGLFMAVVATEDAAASGAATVAFVLQDSADNSTFVDVASSAAVGKAALKAGQVVAFMSLPLSLRRYVRLNYVVATGPLTAGKFSAQVVLGIQRNNFYAAGTTT